ncbi:hypothetical protein NDU88_007895 [Pleurodeles waltl]|uniref:Uncharacterized protein n=1 Tax=Pleurodeles waltl TaxID=8319 RepID=A0AAV7N5K5_PLEWA|nr:hypothetical protein NDU88_007895 [Pleurodeles waltl]
MHLGQSRDSPQPRVGLLECPMPVGVGGISGTAIRSALPAGLPPAAFGLQDATVPSLYGPKQVHSIYNELTGDPDMLQVVHLQLLTYNFAAPRTND